MTWGDEGEVEFEVEIEPVECSMGRCPVVGTDLVLDPSGGVWLLGEMTTPGSVAGGDGAVGLGSTLARFDADGTQSFGVVLVDSVSTFGGLALQTSEPRVDARGHLLLLAAVPGGAALELRDYDRDGRLVAARRLVDGAQSGRAVIEVDGALTLGFEWSDAGPPDGGAGSGRPPIAPRSLDVARFDPEGRLVWNHPVSRSLWGEATPLARGRLAAVDATQAYVMGTISSDVSPERALLAAIDHEGRTRWVLEQENVRILGARARPGGGLLLGYPSTSPSSARGAIVALTADGSPEWTAGIPFSAEHRAVDDDGRVWGVQDYHPPIAWALSEDGKRCAGWPLAGTFCAPSSSEENAETCFSPVVRPASDGMLYVTGGTTLSRVRMGGLP
ncbi:MAG: hypothetical protein FJ104_08155 [Deltaproteobacteria bacterium]|nr:hypothetical protein [Deltaproteobacteria bacterium]